MWVVSPFTPVLETTLPAASRTMMRKPDVSSEVDAEPWAPGPTWVIWPVPSELTEETTRSVAPDTARARRTDRCQIAGLGRPSGSRPPKLFQVLTETQIWLS